MNFISTETNITLRWIAFFCLILAIAYLVKDNSDKYDEKIQSVNRFIHTIKLENGKMLFHTHDVKEIITP